MSRKFWLDQMLKIASPVLKNLSQGSFRKNFPIDFHKRERSDPYLEGFARVFCGIAPWLDLEFSSGGGVESDYEAEKRLQTEFRQMALISLDLATNPNSPEFMDFSKQQSLVEAAFLSQGLVRAQKNFIPLLPKRVKANLISCLTKARQTNAQMKPYGNNWILFGAMVEAGLCILGSDYQTETVKFAINKVETWYKGDGIYGDGAELHCDYYNSFVIYPILTDIVCQSKEISAAFGNIKEGLLKKASRFSAILEKLISPEGAYPIIGRSIAYRFGAFHLLAQAALMNFLAGELKPAQVRCALGSVIRRVMSSDIFDKQGWLIPGIIGFQPSLAEDYINTGSLYLCMTVFLPLGLSPQEHFWADDDEKWSSKKVYEGMDVKRDCAYKIDKPAAKPVARPAPSVKKPEKVGFLTRWFARLGK